MRSFDNYKLGHESESEQKSPDRSLSAADLEGKSSIYQDDKSRDKSSNILDRLFEKKDSQYSQLNAKINRLRTGHSKEAISCRNHNSKN